MALLSGDGAAWRPFQFSRKGLQMTNPDQGQGVILANLAVYARKLEVIIKIVASGET